MKPKIVITLIAIALMFGLEGCKPKETTVSGQAFIVTRGGENIKLGLLEVQLIEKDAVKEFVQKRQVAVEVEIAARQSNFLSVRNAYEKAKADYSAFLTNNPTTKQNYIDLNDRRIALEKLVQTAQMISETKDSLSNSIISMFTAAVTTFCKGISGLEEEASNGMYVQTALIHQKDYLDMFKALNAASGGRFKTPEITNISSMFVDPTLVGAAARENGYRAESEQFRFNNIALDEAKSLQAFLQQELNISRRQDAAAIVTAATNANFLSSDTEAYIGQTDIGRQLKSKSDVMNRLMDVVKMTTKAARENDLLSLQEATQAITDANKYKDYYQKWLTEVNPVVSDNENKLNQNKLNQLASEVSSIESEMKSQQSNLQEQLAVTKAKVESLQSVFNASYPKIETYFTNFAPVVFQKTTTDADGKFSLSYPQDKAFAVFAKAERLVGDKTEKYCWLINAPSGVEKTQLFLSNNNLVFTDTDGYFKIRPKPELQESTHQ